MPAFDAVVVAPNSAIDSYYSLSSLEMGGVNQAQAAFHTAGGKGFNLSRALRNLGGRPLSLGVVGGQAGSFIASQLELEGIAHELVWGPHESRRCNTLSIAGQPDTTVILEPGQPVGQAVVEEFGACVRRHAWDAPFLVFTGSLLPDFPLSYYADLIRAIKSDSSESGSFKICIDSSNLQLRLAAQAGANLIKVNRIEFESAFLENGQSFSWQFARATLEQYTSAGLEILVITDGPKGAYLFSQEQAPIHVLTPGDRVVSTAGSGDTFLAAMLLALGRGQDLQAAACLASAAAAANLQKLGCGFFDPQLVHRCLALTRLETLEADLR